MGHIEQGLRADLRKLGITEPKSALEWDAILLARSLDTPGLDPIVRATLSRELRLTLADVREQPAPTHDAVQDIASRCREEL